MNKEIELLDFCRVKKIFEKGFGFLSSIYFEENIFFHFSKVRDKVARESLQNMKRGVVYVFYTSEPTEEKRKVKRLWTDLQKVDTRLIPNFVEKVIVELKEGKTNIFETAHVIKLLREAELLPEEKFMRILESSKVAKTSTIIKPMLTEVELNKFEKFESLIEDIKNSKIEKTEWIELILGTIN
ncbi:MAG: hypothetical protein GY936_20925 [Ignavibacteriae bacterium]|nr:hypothetical protein [Ignavibacteriota bacterium]